MMVLAALTGLAVLMLVGSCRSVDSIGDASRDDAAGHASGSSSGEARPEATADGSDSAYPGPRDGERSTYETAAAVDVGPLPQPTPTPQPMETPLPTPAPDFVVEIVEEGGALPAGALVAYTDVTGLWVIEGTRSPERVVEGRSIGRVKVAPDGRRILYHQGVSEHPNPMADWHVYDRGTSTSESLPLPDMREPDADMAALYGKESVERLITQLEWTPRLDADLGAVWLALRTADVARAVEDPGMFKEADDLWLIDLVERDSKRILGPGEGGFFSFSPDGSSIALARTAYEANPPTVALANFDGSDRRVLLEHVHVNSGTDYVAFADPRWTADGGAIFVTVYEESTYPGFAEYNLDVPVVYELGVDGSVEKHLELPVGSIRPAMPYGPLWASNASRFAIVAPVPTPTPIATLDPNAYPPPSDDPFLSPDKWPHELIVFASDGTSRTVVSTDAFPIAHGFSPDGEAIVYGLSGESSSWNLLVREGDELWALPDGLDLVGWASDDVSVLRRFAMNERYPGRVDGLAVWRRGEAEARMIAIASPGDGGEPVDRATGITTVDVRYPQ